jgi:hypothetical protein
MFHSKIESSVFFAKSLKFALTSFLSACFLGSELLSFMCVLNENEL